MFKIFYSTSYVSSTYAFDTTRKSKWIADSLIADPIRGIEVAGPTPLTEADVLQIHDSAYVRAVQTGRPRSLAQSQGFDWDPGLWPMVLASNGRVVAAARQALRHGPSGSLSSGLHHAGRHRGHGFCTFNGLVIAAQVSLATGAGAILILDLDAHCGGGTHELIADEPRIWQVDVSTSDYDDYSPTAQGTLDIVTAVDDYLPTIRRRLTELEASNRRFDLCLYNAGMDPYERCSTGGLPGIDAEMLDERERLVFTWCANERIPVAFVLAGGYVSSSLDEVELVELHRLTLLAAAVAAGRRPQSGSGRNCGRQD